MQEKCAQPQGGAPELGDVTAGRRYERSGLTASERALALALAGTMLIVPFGAAAVLARTVADPLDSFASMRHRAAGIASVVPQLDMRSKIYARDGTLLAILHGEENREPIVLDDVPEHVRGAVLAAEDRRFFEHDGIDRAALSRAFVANAREGEIRQGGGTITMQLARNSYLQDRSRTWDRKWNEMLVARRLEQRLSKQEILERYLNTVYFGGGAYGITVAAETFFGKPVSRLSIAEAALLAGVIRAPGALDPWTQPDAARARRDQVLRAMQSNGAIGESDFRRASKSELRLKRRRASNGIVTMTEAGRSFVSYVKLELLRDKRLGKTKQERARRLFSGGLRIRTTLDMRAQRAAEHTIADVLDRRGDPSAALVGIEPSTGDIRAMAGGKDPLGFNLAAQGRRQPGSTFKTFTLVAALEKGHSLYDMYNGSSGYPIRMRGGRTWRVRNYSGSPGGWMSLLNATRFSVNAVYAQAAMRVGLKRVAAVAHRMGITSDLETFPSMSLGALTRGVSPLEMASAYATIANRGVAMKPLAVRSVRDHAGKVILRNSPKGRRAIPAKVAAQAAFALEQVVETGTGRAAQALGRPAAGKTGTTDEYRDSWFVGFTPQMSTAVWLGYPKVSKPLYNIHGLPRVYGGSLPCEIWTRFMLAAHRGLPEQEFPNVPMRRSGSPYTGRGGSYSGSSGSSTSSSSGGSTSSGPSADSGAGSDTAGSGSTGSGSTGSGSTGSGSTGSGGTDSGTTDTTKTKGKGRGTGKGQTKKG